MFHELSHWIEMLAEVWSWPFNMTPKSTYHRWRLHKLRTYFIEVYMDECWPAQHCLKKIQTTCARKPPSCRRNAIPSVSVYSICVQHISSHPQIPKQLPNRTTWSWIRRHSVKSSCEVSFLENDYYISFNISAKLLNWIVIRIDSNNIFILLKIDSKCRNGRIKFDTFF